MTMIWRTGIARVVLSVVLMVVGPGAVQAGDQSHGSDESFEALLVNSPVIQRFGYSLDFTEDALNGRDVESTIEYALKNNQKLQAAFTNYRAVNETVEQVSSLPDLRLGYVEYFKPVETRVGPQRRSVSISQSFPWFGTLGQGGEINREKALAARANFDNVILEVVAATKTAYHEFAYLAKAIEVTGEHVRLLTQWEDVARARYSSGSGQYADVIKSQVELGVLLDRFAELEDQRRPLASDLNALLNRAPTTPVEVESDSAPGIPEFDPAELTARMLADNPLLQAWDHQAQASLNAEKFAGKQGYPRFSLGLNYIFTGEARSAGVPDSGTDAFMASFGLSLPLWRGKYDSASREAVSRYHTALASRGENTNTLQAALERSLFRFRNAARKVELYRTTLIPKGRQSLGALRAAYEAGESRYLDLIDAERLLLEFELSKIRGGADVLIQEAAIERVVAGPLVPRISPRSQRK